MGYLKSRGDYGPRTYRGDPGLLGGLLGGIGGFIKGGPTGAVSGALKGLKGKPKPKPESVQVTRTPGVGGAIARILPGGQTGYEVVTGRAGGRRRRMNVTNSRALRRAIRRQAGFVKLARKALAGTGFTIVSRGSRKRPVSIRESGPGSVIVR